MSTNLDEAAQTAFAWTWSMLPVRHEYGSFETLANAIYNDGFAGEKDKRDETPITDMQNVVYLPLGQLPPQDLLNRVRKDGEEYMHYEYLKVAGLVLDRAPNDGLGLDLFVSSLGWIMYLGKERDATFAQTLLNSGKQASLKAVMESTGLARVDVEAFVEMLMTGDAHDLAIRRMAAFPAIAAARL